jgi:septum formation protein
VAEATTAPVLLASGSPQRSAILQQLGYCFRRWVPDVDERAHGDVVALAEWNAAAKAHAAIPAVQPGELILAVDTVVELDGVPWGKPATRDDARATLLELRGRTHHVIGGMSLVLPDGEHLVTHVVTAVRFRSFELEMLDRYLDGGEWQGRAGSYAIQGSGAAFVAGIDGDYFNVVGLPVACLHDMLDQRHIRLQYESALG